jgi:uncharacterized protein Usg
MTSDRNFVSQLQGYSLTTAEILYHMPDHQHLLQSYIWQEYDQAPELPRLHKFLDFWVENLDGPLHSVRYSTKKLISPNEWRHVDGELLLN